MDKKLRITDDHWTYGSYHRIHYKKDMLYTFFQYVDVHFIWNVGMGTFSLQDRLVERLQENGLISEEAAHRYQETALQFLSQMSSYDEWPIEDIYGQIRRIRRDVLGTAVLEVDRHQQMMAGLSFEVGSGIDQRAKKEDLLQEKKAAVFALCQPEYFLLMKEDVEKMLANSGRVYLLVSQMEGTGLPVRQMLEATFGDEAVYLPVEDAVFKLDRIACDDMLQADIDQGKAVLYVYGEEGLLHCRNLQIESVVQAKPYGYHARTMVNQLEGGQACVVYAPRCFDITNWVKTTEKTKLSYWQLWQLWKDHGDGIYQMTVEQLYGSYPQYFLNVYECGDACPEAREGYPIQIRWPEDGGAQDSIARYYHLRDQVIASYMSQWSGLTYLSTYFTKKMEQVPIPWDSQGQQTGILVHGIRVAAAENARVIPCDAAMTLRQQLQQSQGESQGKQSHQLRLYSNFLFFLTPKLAELYNQLREDRPREQLREKQGHLDYQMYWQDGKRVESFPLYDKAVLAKKKDGRFLLCQYKLGGGLLKIVGAKGAEVSLSWSAEAVNTPDTGEETQVYTPYLSRDDQGEGMFANSYRRMVGAERINLVIIQDKIHCIRKGDVVLPSIGVVVSLSQSYGQNILDKLGAVEQENGYFDVDGLSLCLQLDGPAQMDPAQWKQVEWAYGGGLSLITEGRSIYGGETIHDMEEEQGACWLKKEGWLSPLSRQTQESALHVLVKHPRTAIGMAGNGDLFVLVFSGRTPMSTGADYQEMCHMAKALIPDVETMMNVDGGGSSVLGMAIDGHFMELSYPATSMSSCAGMVRRVNTVLSLEV